MMPVLTKERGMSVPPAPPQRDERRTEGLETALAQIDKQFGKGSIMRLSLDVIVIDSVAALVPKAELEGEMGDTHVGLQARLMSQALRKLTASVSKSHTCLVFINQIREKIGVMFGSPETTPGGRALKFYSSVRIDIRRVNVIKDAMGKVIGSHVRTKIVKNKVAAPFAEAEWDIMYDVGIAKERSVIDVATDLGVLEKKGSWLAFNGEMIGQGREAAKDFLRANPKTLEAIVAVIREKVAAGGLVGQRISGDRAIRKFE